MAEAAQHPVNIRKRRILEAFKEDSAEEAQDFANILQCLDLSTPREESPTPPEIKTKLVSTDKDESKILDMKMNVLENWEISKRNCIEKMVKDVEKLQEMEDEVDKLEDLLEEKNIEIDEDEYEASYQKYLEEHPLMEPLDLLQDILPQTPKRDEQQTKRVKISATSTPIARKSEKVEVTDKFMANEDGMVVIGPNGTMISKTALTSINWSLAGAALTRKILMEVFDRETLAFHTLTGKPSPAFMDCDKPMKNQLDPLKVADIIHLAMEHTNLTAKEVRNAITTKCADENKMYRQREKKRLNAALKLQQKEN